MIGCSNTFGLQVVKSRLEVTSESDNTQTDFKCIFKLLGGHKKEIQICDRFILRIVTISEMSVDVWQK